MIPDDVVEEVRSRADIVEVVGEVVPLKRSGKDYKGKCPFHEDRTPSFYVVPAKGLFHCFGCGVSGDVFTFLMKRQGLEFTDAVKAVGGRFGVEVREVSARRAEDDPHRPLHEANAFARDFFRERLAAPDGERARRYLEQRGISDAVAERFQLGYAPDAWHELRDAAARHGIDETLLLTAGLLSRSEKRDAPYDRFRDRLVFPIESSTGRVVAFGGRVLGPATGTPKYLNSPESPVYHKGRELYGLSWAKHEIRRQEAALLVEGYMDVVSLAAAGVAHVVASLGTATTHEQAELLKRYTTHVYLLFDSDAAGLKATFRAGDVLLGVGIRPSVVTLPPGEDPDSLVRTGGGGALKPYLEQAVDVLDRKIQILDERGYFSSIDKTRRSLDRLLPTVRAARDAALRDLYVDRVAARTGVRRETIESELARPSHAPPEFRPVPPPSTPPPPSAPVARRRMGAERQLLLVLLRNRGWIPRAAEIVGPESFMDRAYRRIYEILLDEPGLEHVPPDLDPGLQRRFEDLFGDPEVLEHGGQVFEHALAAIQIAELDRRIDALDARIGRATGEEKQALVAEKQTLMRERSMLGENWRRSAGNLQRLNLNQDQERSE
ncbi:MAG: DNA primase [Gemmatimonadota bacterium]